MKFCSDFKYVDKMLKKRSGSRFKLIYKFTTENISGYINEFDFKDKTMLTVGSSGDQAINSNYCGCNDVTIIDLNPLTLDYFNLKKAAILTLKYEEFLDFFSLYNDTSFIPKYLYSKIRDALRVIDIKSLMLWDYIFDSKYFANRSNLFHYQDGEHTNIKVFNQYLQCESNYNIEKEKIKKLKVKFINSDIFDCNKIFKLEKFDNINLSNIYIYNKSNYRIKKFKNSVSYLSNMLNDGGRMLVAYLNTSYGSIMNCDNISIINNQIYISFIGIWGIYKGSEATDTIIMYEKPKQLSKV